MDLTIRDLSDKSDSKKFIHKNLPQFPFYMTITGCSFSGKTNMILNLLKFSKKVIKKENIFWFSSTFSSNLEKKGIQVYPDLMTEDGVNIVERLLEVQKKNVEQFGKKKTPHLLLVFDDFVTDSELNRRRGLFQKLFSTARHYNISVIITSQSYTLIPASIRRMSLYTILYPIFNKAELKTVIAENQRKMDEDDFLEVYDNATDGKYNFLYIDIANEKYMKNFEKVLHQG